MTARSPGKRNGEGQRRHWPRRHWQCCWLHLLHTEHCYSKSLTRPASVLKPAQISAFILLQLRQRCRKLLFVALWNVGARLGAQVLKAVANCSGTEGRVWIRRIKLVQARLCPLNCRRASRFGRLARRRCTGRLLWGRWRPATCWLIQLGFEVLLGLEQMAAGQAQRKGLLAHGGASACRPQAPVRAALTQKRPIDLTACPSGCSAPAAPCIIKKCAGNALCSAIDSAQSLRGSAEAASPTYKGCHRDSCRPKEQCTATAGRPRAPACCRPPAERAEAACLIEGHDDARCLCK